MKKVIIDSDFGIDDAVAVLLALESKDFEVLGITTVYGNVDIKQATNNAYFLLEQWNYNIPIFRGEEMPLEKDLYISTETHGKNGLGNIIVNKDYEPADQKDAWEFIIEMVERYPEEITVITLGPLTNIASAILKNPTAMIKVREIVSMGGGILKGNMSPVAEFNIWCDPEAAKIVYDAEIPIKMVGLDVTHRVILTPNHIEFVKLIGGEKGEFLGKILDYYTSYYWNHERILGCVMHDPLAVAIAANQSLAKYVHSHVDISLNGITRGECVVDLVDAWCNQKNADVAVDVFPEEFFDYFFRSLFRNNVNQYLEYKEFQQKINKRG
ncbi:nucleoside hydrolase [Cytobacillus sp. FJAT-54145]|uniref:Nucleoside hydrolase n=1 Tax=Cytobacillus spartinae TaxID=3299023 RepID=A0ABW6K6P2_9BACI